MNKNDGAGSLVRSDALLACPFCGHIPELSPRDDGQPGFMLRHFDTGTNYFCPVPSKLYGERYIEAWNIRNANVTAHLRAAQGEPQ